MAVGEIPQSSLSTEALARSQSSVRVAVLLDQDLVCSYDFDSFEQTNEFLVSLKGFLVQKGLSGVKFSLGVSKVGGSPLTSPE